jgi:hypothetical protein
VRCVQDWPEKRLAVDAVDAGAGGGEGVRSEFAPIVDTSGNPAGRGVQSHSTKRPSARLYTKSSRNAANVCWRARRPESERQGSRTGTRGW